MCDKVVKHQEHIANLEEATSTSINSSLSSPKTIEPAITMHKVHNSQDEGNNYELKANQTLGNIDDDDAKMILDQYNDNEIDKDIQIQNDQIIAKELGEHMIDLKKITAGELNTDQLETKGNGIKGSNSVYVKPLNADKGIHKNNRNSELDEEKIQIQNDLLIIKTLNENAIIKKTSTLGGPNGDMTPM